MSSSVSPSPTGKGARFRSSSFFVRILVGEEHRWKLWVSALWTSLSEEFTEMEKRSEWSRSHVELRRRARQGCIASDCERSTERSLHHHFKIHHCYPALATYTLSPLDVFLFSFPFLSHPLTIRTASIRNTTPWLHMFFAAGTHTERHRQLSQIKPTTSISRSASPELEFTFMLAIAYFVHQFPRETAYRILYYQMTGYRNPPGRCTNTSETRFRSSQR